MGRIRNRMQGNKSKSGWPSLFQNEIVYNFYYQRLKNLAINAIEWVNLPPEIDERFLEITLFENGYGLFYREDIVEQYVALPCTIGGELDIYNIPKFRMAFATNGYHYYASDKDSVIIFNNYLRTPGVEAARFYAYKLYEIERSQNVNIKSQKFPVLVRASEKQRLTALNLYQQYDGNEPFIFGDSQLNPELFQVLNTNAPYVSDKLQQLKESVWKEALLYFGIDTQIVKPERLTVLESAGNMGTIEAERFVRINARRQAADKINSMFGLNIFPRYRYSELTNYDSLDKLNRLSSESKGDLIE